jgi:DNA-binding response OmpR family regulator/GGDEF domain-containing protein
METQDADADTGLLNAAAFARLLKSVDGEANSQAVAVTIKIAEAEAMRRQFGDAIVAPLMQHAGRVLADQFRDDDQIGRTGPLEFGVLLPMEDMDGFQIAMKRVTAAMAREMFTLPDGRAEAVTIVSEGRPVGAQDRKDEKDWQQEKSKTLIGTVSGVQAQAPSGPARYVGISISNAVTATVLSTLLERAGYRVVNPSGTGNERLAPFARSKMHLIIADDPQTTVPLIRATLGRRRTPVIIISETEQLGEWALENGAREYVAKPVRMEVLLAAIKRQVRRGRQDAEAVPSSAGGILVASDEVGQLIALGSALQKQGGFFVRFGRGHNDAMTLIQDNSPGAVLVDMSLRRDETRALLKFIAAMNEPPAVILVVNENEMAHAARVTELKPAGILKKPVDLKTLHLETQRLANRTFGSNAAKSQEILRSEILRTMRAK